MALTIYDRQSAALYEEALRLSTKPDVKKGQVDSLHARIQTLQQRIVSTGNHSAHSKALLNLLYARNVTALNTFQDKQYACVVNTLSPKQPISPLNIGFHDFHIPLVSTYHQISVPVFSARLSPAHCLSLVPASLLKSLGNLKGKRIDFYELTQRTSYPRHYYRQKRPFNLNSHQWAHHDLLPGMSIKKKIPMGLFPIYGIKTARGATKHHKPQPISLNSLSPITVHSHPGNPKKNQADMLYSPDTAHFMIDPLSPFSVTWAAAKDGERIFISHMTLLHDPNNSPIIKAVQNAAQGTANLHDYLFSLKTNVVSALGSTFNPILDHLDKGSEATALKLFNDLPEWHKIGILHQASLLKKTATKTALKIDLLPIPDRTKAIKAHIQNLEHLLINEPTRLLNLSTLAMIEPDPEKATLNTLGQAFENNDSSALSQFDSLSPQLQTEVYRAIWRTKGYPRGDDSHSRKRLFLSSSNQERANALYLAAIDKPFSPKTSSEKIEKPAHAELFQKISMLKPLKTQERLDKLNKLFDKYKIDKEKVKYPIYDEIGRLAGQPAKKRRDYGRRHFADNLELIKKLLIK